MSASGRRGGGSKYLYEPFDAASARIETHERVTEARWEALEQRLTAMEATLDRLERRVWLGVAGLAAFLAMDAGYTIFSTNLP